VKGDFGGSSPSLSSGGTKVAFDSDSKNLDPRDTSRDTDVYVKDLKTGDLVLASTNDDGVKADGFSERPALSGNGRRVAFVSDATNLDPADTNNDWDVYIKDLVTGDISLVTTSSDGVKGGEDTDEQFPSISGKGRRVAFHTDQRLDPGDPDDIADVYVKDPILCTTMGTPGNDVMVGTGSDDVMCGAGGIDVIDGAGGDDVLFGGDDDDFILGGPGSDRIDGGPGTDTADYSASDQAVAVDLSTSSGTGGDAEGDLLAGVEAMVGSPFGDTLTGDDADNFFVGGGGADDIDGGGGTDMANYASSGAGVTVNLDKIIVKGGDAAGDVLTAIENVSGSAFDDILTGDDGPNLLQGGNGNDDLSGKGGSDTLLGQAGTATFDGDGGSDTCDDVAGETATSCES
jgi:Ca2+-binding RTX toxin-like protein